MKRHRQLLIDKKLIRKEIYKYLRRLEAVKGRVDRSQYDSITDSENNFYFGDDNLDLIMAGITNMLLNKRILSGALPYKDSAHPMKVFFHPAIVAFTENNIFSINPDSVDLTPYAEDRWAYIYIDTDGSYIVNKYPPIIGSNQNRIPVCKVWLDTDTTSWNDSLIRDLRMVGVASASVHHVVRQLMINLMHSMPSIITKDISVTPTTVSADPKLYVRVQTSDNNILFGRLTPLPDANVEIPQPISGTQNYVLLARAVISTDDPDDLAFQYIVKEVGEDIENYEIPLAIIKDVDSIQVEILSSQIETFGVQKKKEDFYTYDFVFNYKPEEEGGYLEKVVTVTSDYTVNIDDHVILVDAGSLPSGVTNLIITLPSAIDLEKKEYYIKKIDTSLNTVTIQCQGGETIDGDSNIIIEFFQTCIALVSDNSNWHII